MISETKKFILENDLIPSKGLTIFAAVSGGIDSCVMLDVLSKICKDFSYSIEILHFNHNTRGKENTKDALFVKKLAKKYTVPVRVKKIENNTGKISEAFLRDQRYKFFGSVLKNSKKALIATAHNSDDNVETLLMRLFRGSHLKGLTGIRPKRGRYIRPFLSQNRYTIEEYAKKYKIEFRQDHSNYDNQYTRNFIRNQLIPIAQENLKLNISENILNSILDLNQYYSFYTKNLQISIKESVRITKYGVSLNKSKYKLYDNTIQKGLIEYCISIVQPLNYGISKKNFKLWDDFIKNSSPGKKRNILNSGYAISERKEIVFGGLPEEKNESHLLKLNSEIILDNKYKLSFTEVESKNINFNIDKNVEFIDGDKSGNKLIVRFWEKGDSFRPLGMKQNRKLSDFFIDLKLSTFLKNETPIICKSDEIVWVAGYRLSDQYKISDFTKTFYRIEMTEVKDND